MSWQDNPRNVLILLLVSLGINCVVAGVGLAGALLVETRARYEDEVARAVNRMPPEIHNGLVAQIAARQAEMHAAQKELQNARQDALNLMQQPELDLEALRGSLAARRAAAAHIEAIMQDSFVAALRELPSEQRGRAAQRMLTHFRPVVRLFDGYRGVTKSNDGKEPQLPSSAR